MKAVSFHNGNIHPEILRLQAAVFKRFGINHKQIQSDLPHGEAIDQWLNISKDEYFMIFDIDCIPLNADVVKTAFSIIQDGKTQYGAAQHANHIPTSQIYCSPAFCCFSKELWVKCGKPSFAGNQWHDVGSFFSTEAKREGDRILIWPTHVEVPKWDLGLGSTFGYGTTYDNEVYHAFESRYNGEGANRFIAKCKSILNEN